MDRKVAPRYHDGQKYMVLSDLPFGQEQMFCDWVALSSFLPDPARATENFSELVRYEDYEYWFDQYFLTEKDMDHYF